MRFGSGLLMFLGSATWAQAQELLSATNAPTAATVAAAAPKVWLTFGLDRVPWMQRQVFSGIPLWQCVASLVFIFLAFYVSCVAITWWFYTRPGGLLHDVERGDTPAPAATVRATA